MAGRKSSKRPSDSPATAYTKARPSVRRRFNDAVLQVVYIKDRNIGRAEFSEVFAPLFSRPSSNKRLKVDPRGFETATATLATLIGPPW